MPPLVSNAPKNDPSKVPNSSEHVALSFQRLTELAKTQQGAGQQSPPEPQLYRKVLGSDDLGPQICQHLTSRDLAQAAVADRVFRKLSHDDLALLMKIDRDHLPSMPQLKALRETINKDISRFLFNISRSLSSENPYRRSEIKAACLAGVPLMGLSAGALSQTLSNLQQSSFGVAFFIGITNGLCLVTMPFVGYFLGALLLAAVKAKRINDDLKPNSGHTSDSGSEIKGRLQFINSVFDTLSRALNTMGHADLNKISFIHPARDIAEVILYMDPRAFIVMPNSLRDKLNAFLSKIKDETPPPETGTESEALIDHALTHLNMQRTKEYLEDEGQLADERLRLPPRPIR